MIRLETKKKKVNPNAKKSRTDIDIAKIEEILVQTQIDYVAQRLSLSGISNASMFARLGDEENLRDELRNPDFVINERDVVTGKNVLMEAVAGGHFHLVRMLLFEFHASATVVALLGKSTPLHIAIEKGYRQIASMLITRGADVNAVDSRGCTPMHFAWKLGCARLLHRYPVNCCIRSKDNLRPSEYYVKYCPSEDFDVAVHKFLTDKEEEYDVKSFRKLTLAGEQHQKDKEAELLRLRDDSDDYDFDVRAAEAEAVDDKVAKRQKLLAHFKSSNRKPLKSSTINPFTNKMAGSSTGPVSRPKTGPSKTSTRSSALVISADSNTNIPATQSNKFSGSRSPGRK